MSLSQFIINAKQNAARFAQMSADEMQAELNRHGVHADAQQLVLNNDIAGINGYMMAERHFAQTTETVSLTDGDGPIMNG